MKIIKQYTADISWKAFAISVPAGSKILHWKLDTNLSIIFCEALVDIGACRITRKFRIVEANEQYDFNNRKYVGTVSNDYVTWHIFEVI